MSLSIDGVWKAGVWAETVWADGVWREGDPPSIPINPKNILFVKRDNRAVSVNRSASSIRVGSSSNKITVR